MGAICDRRAGKRGGVEAVIGPPARGPRPRSRGTALPQRHGDPTGDAAGAALDVILRGGRRLRSEIILQTLCAGASGHLDHQMIDMRRDYTRAPQRQAAISRYCRKCVLNRVRYDRGARPHHKARP